MKVRFEIFKSFIRVDLQLQLEVEVDLPRQIRVFRVFLRKTKANLKKKGRACASPGEAPGCLFFFLIGLHLP